MASMRGGRPYGTIDDRQKEEIVRRAKAGEFAQSIADSMELPGTSVNAICRKVREVLGMPSMTEQRAAEAEARRDEVLRRSNDGQTDREIAAAMGSTTSAIAKVRIQAAGVSKYRLVKLSDEDRREMDRRLMAGESTRAVAHAIGCSQKPVTDRAKTIRHLIPTDLPPCACGKPNNHGGRCQLSLERQAELRERLLKGDKVDHIAADFGYSGQNIRAYYARPIIAELRAAGVHCPCGKQIAHNGMCIGHGTPASIRAQQAELREQVLPLLQHGMTRNAIASHLGVTVGRVYLIAKPILADWAANGVKCGCGEPISHRGICPSRSALPKGRGSRSGWARYKREARQLSWYDRGRARALLTRGRSNAYVAGLIGCAEGPIKAMVRALEKSGVVLPDCKCGLPRNHSGNCASRPSKPIARPRKKSPIANIPRETRRQLVELYKHGTTNSRMSELTGLSLWKVSTVVAYWKNNSRYELPPCACGRPGRHSGGCAKYKSNAIDKRTLAFVEQQVRAGVLPHVVAEKIGAAPLTVLRHTADLRERMVAEGQACGCGRPIGHQYWCSSKWESYEMPRGRRPRSTDATATTALLRGDTVANISRSLGLPTTSLWRLLATLPAEQRAERRTGIKARMRRDHALHDGRVLAMIEAAVPKRIDPALRGDIIGELQLAVAEGHVEVEQIRTVVKSFINRGLSEWQSAYGPRSLDQKIGEDGTRTLGDFLDDRTALAGIDDIVIGGDA